MRGGAGQVQLVQLAEVVFHGAVSTKTATPVGVETAKVVFTLSPALTAVGL